MAGRTVYRATFRLVLQPWFRLSRGLTLGVRALVADEAGGVLLVRHGYAPGWILPGGGVERGETAENALMRELAEEAGIVPLERPRLLGLLANDAQFPGDHIAVFTVGHWRQQPRTASTLEIAEQGFFPPDALPEGTTGGTRRRIAEWQTGAPVPDRW